MAEDDFEYIEIFPICLKYRIDNEGNLLLLLAEKEV